MGAKISLLRHGESLWNQQNRFTGWVDIDLSKTGIAEANNAGLLLSNKHVQFDVAFTSLLKRANKTLGIALDVLGQDWVPVHKSWQLNERHYGLLQGMNKTKAASKYGEEQVFRWRRGFLDRPPEMERSDVEKAPWNDRRYDALGKENIPTSESLKEVLARVVPYWEGTIAPWILGGKNVLIVAHGNSLRALLMHLEGLNEQGVEQLNIPTATPINLHIGNKLQLLRKDILGD